LSGRTSILTALVLGAAGWAYWSYAAKPPEGKPPVVLARVAAPVTLKVDAPPEPPAPAPSAADQSRQLSSAIERALVAADPAMRETAFNVLLPELLELDASEAAAILERHREPASRVELREQLTRRWVVRDRDSATRWMRELPDEDRREAAVIAVRALAAQSPVQALELADEFAVGRDDGTRDYLIQMWAAEDPAAAAQWLASQGE